jgi:hypothetical protein
MNKTLWDNKKMKNYKVKEAYYKCSYSLNTKNKNISSETPVKNGRKNST